MLDNASKIFKCDLCGFTNNDVGGMKRHITGKHKGEKRGHEEGPDGDSLDDRDDKRPKTDDLFEPSLASTIIEDEEFEFEEALLDEQNDLNDDDDTTLHMSDETLARLGDEFSQKSKPQTQETDLDADVNSALQADIAVSNVRTKSLEIELKAKELKVAELVNEVDKLNLMLNGCGAEIAHRDREI